MIFITEWTLQRSCFILTQISTNSCRMFSNSDIWILLLSYLLNKNRIQRITNQCYHLNLCRTLSAVCTVNRHCQLLPCGYREEFPTMGKERIIKLAQYNSESLEITEKIIELEIGKQAGTATKWVCMLGCFAATTPYDPATTDYDRYVRQTVIIVDEHARLCSLHLDPRFPSSIRY